MSLSDKVDSLLTFVQSINEEQKTDNVPPEHLHNLKTFVVEEDLLQNEHLVCFKGNFGDSHKPSIVKIRPSKPKASELKKLMAKMKLSPSGRFGKGFGFYKANCVTKKSFKVDVIYPWVEPEEPENDEEQKQRLQDQQKIFDKFYRRALPKQRFMVRETPELYETITKPWFESIPTASIQWVCLSILVCPIIQIWSD